MTCTVDRIYGCINILKLFKTSTTHLRNVFGEYFLKCLPNVINPTLRVESNLQFSQYSLKLNQQHIN